MTPLLPAEFFAYQAIATLTDDSGTVLDLEEQGWASKEMLSRVKVWSIAPKNADSSLPTVVVNIPEGAKPVFKSRVFGTMGVASSEGGPLFRCYAIGYKKGSSEFLAWILPSGDIEIGPDPHIAEAIISNS